MGAKIPQMDIARRLTKIYRKNILDAPPGQDCSLKNKLLGVASGLRFRNNILFIFHSNHGLQTTEPYGLYLICNFFIFSTSVVLFMLRSFAALFLTPLVLRSA
jgi:hypothetical protein